MSEDHLIIRSPWLGAIIMKTPEYATRNMAPVWNFHFWLAQVHSQQTGVTSSLRNASAKRRV